MRNRIAQCLSTAPRRALRSDYDLMEAHGARNMGGTRKLTRRAAVLVPIIDRKQGATVLLTRRCDHLKTHAGQISFPGGRQEPGDTDAIATALRETHEEVGLAHRRVDILGRLDTYETVTGYRITPVVGLITPPIALILQEDEVAEAFEIPLDFVLDPTNHQRHSREFEGRTRHFYALPYGQYYIWGATAHMLVNLAQALRDGTADGGSL